jgi:spermidine synthase
MLLVAGLYLAYGCLLLAWVPARAGASGGVRRAAAAAAAVAALIAPWWIRPWDHSLLGGFQNDQIQYWLDAHGSADLHGRMSGWSVLYYREGRGSTVSVVDQGWNRTLIVNGKAEASDDPVDGHIQLLLGHVPVLMHPSPKRAFVLGMGTGITLGAVAAHPGLEEIVLAEIEPAVLGAQSFLAASSGDPLGDPRVRVEIQDGRNYLKTTPGRFDVITADPIHPWTSGSVYLYTREYYEIAAAHLATGGVMCQWIPITGISADNVRSVVATFSDVFPHTSLWQTSHDVLLIGSNGPLAPAWEGFVSRLSEPRVAAQLRPLGLDDPISFLAEQGMDDAGVRAYAEGAPRNTDDNVYLEFSSPLSIGHPETVEVTLRVNRARSALAASGAVSVTGLPPEAQALLRTQRAAKNDLLYAQVQPRRRIERLKRSVADAPGYRPAQIQLARWLAELGSRDLAAGRVPRALARAREAIAVADEPSALLLAGSALARQERYDEALVPIERAIGLAPHRWMAHYQRALALLGAGRRDEATRELETAVAMNPAHPELLERLAELRASAAGG